jgi:stage II sporulation protein D
VTCGDETKNTEPDELLHPADALTDTSGKTYVLKPETEDGRIYLCDQNGTATSNGYFGTIEVRNTENGYTVVNELPLEEYLSAVVPSEMPSNFSAEALKAQAVCARSYAYIQLMRADLRSAYQ